MPSFEVESQDGVAVRKYPKPNFMRDIRTWIEIDQKALRHNVETFLKLIPGHTRLMAVIKSNAYGHGLVPIAKLFSVYQLPATSYQIVWFGVDSIVEALRLRREGIKNRILVSGYTLPSRMKEAVEHDITLTISHTEGLKALAALKSRPQFHLKIDTGMHRQGFLPQDALKLIKLLKLFKLSPQGVYTHFASAKDPADRAYTMHQLSLFGDVISEFERADIRGMIRHAAATGGTLLFPESHLDMVRIGMGLYGYWPSEEIKNQKSKIKNIVLKPVLSWKTIVGEVKGIPKGSFVGYDCTERLGRRTKVAVLPVGYWHGYDRGLSSIGDVLIRGKRAKVLGRVSMDMIVVDVTGIPETHIGDEVVLVGRQGKDALWADELAAGIDTTSYEFLTRINPLIKRVIV